jgi:hypothetical protein
MAANDKYTKVMKGLKPKKAVQEKPEGKNSRGGKSSNPDYRPTTVFFLREEHEKASRFLVGQDMDFSDLMNSLLRKWNAEKQL